MTNSLLGRRAFFRLASQFALRRAVAERQQQEDALERDVLQPQDFVHRGAVEPLHRRGRFDALGRGRHQRDPQADVRLACGVLKFTAASRAGYLASRVFRYLAPGDGHARCGRWCCRRPG